jgi:hypothetical protein
MPTYHCVRSSGAQYGEFLFSALRLFQRMHAVVLYDDAKISSLQWPNWVLHWRNGMCQQAVDKFQDTFFKLVRAANYLSDAINIVKNTRDPESYSQAGPLANSLDDVPLFLDMVWIYLRIQADAYSTLLGFLHENRAEIPLDSFRRQRKWFLETKPAQDPEYRAILLASTQWFDLLAGEDPKGVRDIVIHQRGSYQLRWCESPDGCEFQLEASLIRDTKIVSADVIPTLKCIIHGYFGFLDEAIRHFMARLELIFGSPQDASNPIFKPCFSYKQGALPSAWLFPQCHPDPETLHCGAATHCS